MLLLNCGLHDIKCNPAAHTPAPQVPLERYRRNIYDSITVAREKLGAKLVVWVRTTPVVDDVHNARSTEFHR